MKMSVYCPMCHSGSVDDTEKISVADLAGLYKNMFGEPVLQEFEGYEELEFISCKECDLRFFHPILTASESFYEKLQKFKWYYMDEKVEYDFASKYISETDRVLDIGSGKGAFAKQIRAENYTGLELSRMGRLMAEKEGIYIIEETVQQHAQNNMQKYDVVCSFQVLEHVSDINGFLRSSIESLKIGGLLIISVPSADSFLSSVTNGILNMPPHHISWWSDKSLRYLSVIFGLEIVELHHERLADIHKDWYSSTVALNVLNKLFKRQSRLIDVSRFGRIVSRLAKKIGHFYGLGILDENMRPIGHSVTVVFRKPHPPSGKVD